MVIILQLFIQFLHARKNRHDFFFHLFHFIGQFSHQLIDLLLVVVVKLRYGESTNPSQYDEGESIEPAANIGETPEGQSKLDAVYNTLYEEQVAKLSYEAVDADSNTGGHVRDNLGWDGERKGGDGVERIGVWIRFLECDHHIGV